MPHHRQLTVIEFVGTPASGKTTLCNALAEHMTKNGHHAQYMWRLERRIPFFRIRYKLHADKELKALLNEYTATLSDRKYAEIYTDKILRYAYLIQYAKTKKIRKHHIHYALFNEGCVQFLADMQAEETLNDSALELVHTIREKIYHGCGTVLIQTSVDEKVNLERLINGSRHIKEYEGIGNEEILDILRHMKINIDTSVAQFAFHKNINLDVGSNTKKELSNLLALLRTGKGTPKHIQHRSKDVPSEDDTDTDIQSPQTDLNDFDFDTASEDVSDK